ncbi:hypothetical protein D9758_006778 [Tetrapyrgos nigripes]|uniref:N-acetyltransferase domain-containing protein n=1 Tax=Tetrapyrgos nigripes TaxID=182062 RepID=A0A8H5FU08_9AGAR|nr:hypothetical protein D9758_006778 [Tetrapyrgos nigripes]
MSAYGTFTRSTGDYQLGAILPSTIWCTNVSSSNNTPDRPYITIHHVTLTNALPAPGLISHLASVFGAVVEEGRTYPQEDVITVDSFEKYFFAEDVFIAVQAMGTINSEKDASVTSLTLDEARNGREWETCVVGFYYVKPNYPGRSSHVSHSFAYVVQKSSLTDVHGLPVFGVLYPSHTLHLLWERLGFTKAGRIPQAGRLKRLDGKGEEYVDAWVIYKSFVEEDDAKAQDQQVN